MRNAVCLIFRRAVVLALLISLYSCQLGCGAEDYQRPIKQFQDSSAVVIASARDFLHNVNTVEQNAKIEQLAFEQQPIDEGQIDATHLISQAEIDVRTGALDQLSQYTSNIATLAQGKAATDVGQATQDVGKALIGQEMQGAYERQKATLSN